MFRTTLFLLSWLCLVFTVQADEKHLEFKRADIKSISVVAPLWEGFTNADGTGLYWEVLRAVFEPEEIKIKHANVPWNRAVKMVSKYSVYNAIVGEILDSEEKLIFPKYAIDVERMSVLSLAKRRLEWHGVSSLSNKKIGWMKEYEIIEPKDRDFELVEYRTVEQGLEMLEAGKIDYMIDEWDEISEAVAAKKQDMTQYLMNEMPKGTDIYVAFADTDLSKELIAIYNERFPVLYHDKTLQAIYKKWEMEIPLSVVNALEK
jgi:hypothetical protein